MEVEAALEVVRRAWRFSPTREPGRLWADGDGVLMKLRYGEVDHEAFVELLAALKALPRLSGPLVSHEIVSLIWYVPHWMDRHFRLMGYPLGAGIGIDVDDYWGAVRSVIGVGWEDVPSSP